MPAENRTGQAPRPHDWGMGLCAFAVFALVYALTACPTVFWYDSAEFATAATVLGIAHPPGYPLYTLIGHIFVRVLPVSPAYAVNLMSAFFGAAAVALQFVFIRTLGFSILAAACAAITLATGELYWSQALIAEAYTPALCCLFAINVLLAIGTIRLSIWLMFAASLVGGLSLGIHYGVATCGLGFLFIVCGFGKRRWRFFALCLLGMLLGASVLLYVPLRAAHRPLLNIADFRTTWSEFAWYLRGATYVSHFDYAGHWTERVSFLARLFADQLTPFGVLLAILGLIQLFRTELRWAFALTLMIAGNICVFFHYKTHDVQVFFLPAISILTVGIAPAVDLIQDTLKQLLHASLRQRVLQWVARAALLSLPLGLGATNYARVNLSDYREAEKYAQGLVEQLPQNAYLFSFSSPPEWKNDTVFSMYYQLVLKQRLDVKTYRITPGDISLENIQAVIKQGAEVFAYYPFAWLSENFTLTKEQLVYRVTLRQDSQGFRSAE